MKSVKFKNKDMYWDIAADLHFPPGFDERKKYPAIISAHPIGSCKEQTSGNVYGAALAEAGFVVIAFDRSFQGASGGEPRFIEDPTLAVEDFRHVADYLVTLPYVDEDRIGVLGICGGGGYAVNAAMTERRIRVVGANLAPIGLLDKISKQRTAEARGAEWHVDDLLPPSVEAGKKAGIEDIDVLEATDYYRTPRGQKPHGLNRSLLSHQAAAAGWDAFHLAEVLLTQPLCVVVGDKVGGFGAYRDGCEIVERAASKEKQLVVVEGYSHYDLYDKPEPVGQALARLIPFYKKHLGGTKTAEKAA